MKQYFKVTQTVDSSWRCVGKPLKTGIRSDCLEHPVEYFYRREMKMSGNYPFYIFNEAVKRCILVNENI